MMSARFSTRDYAAAARALMPTGPAWSLSADSTQGKLIFALARALERADASASQLLVDAFPGTTTDLIAEWEASLGLPDAVIGVGATIAQRRAQVLARLVGAGGQSRQRFIDFAAALGFTVTIRTHAPLRAGHFRAGSSVHGQSWADAWGIHVVANTGSLTAAQLKAEIDTIRPAETTTLLV